MKICRERRTNKNCFLNIETSGCICQLPFFWGGGGYLSHNAGVLLNWTEKNNLEVFEIWPKK